MQFICAGLPVEVNRLCANGERSRIPSGCKRKYMVVVGWKSRTAFDQGMVICAWVSCGCWTPTETHLALPQLEHNATADMSALTRRPSHVLLADARHVVHPQGGKRCTMNACVAKSTELASRFRNIAATCTCCCDSLWRPIGPPLSRRCPRLRDNREPGLRSLAHGSSTHRAHMEETTPDAFRPHTEQLPTTSNCPSRRPTLFVVGRSAIHFCTTPRRWHSGGFGPTRTECSLGPGA